MKKNILSILILAVLMFVFLNGCSKLPTSIPQVVTPEVEASLPKKITAPPQVEISETTTVDTSELPISLPKPIPCTLAFDTDRDGNKEIYSMTGDGSNLVNLSNHPADDFDPAWSPDGSLIAFVSNRENEVPGQYIYVMNSDGSEVFQLTFEDGSDFPDWSHDGSALTYSANGDIYVIKADGSGESVNLTNSPEKEHHSSWSPDGNQILFTLDRDGQTPDIFVMNSDGSNLTRVTNNGQNYEAKWTIDGRIFTGWGWNDQEQFCFNCVVNPDGSDIRDAGGKGELGRYFPFWTEAGERVECASIAFNDAVNADIFLIGDIFTDGLYNLTNSESDERNVDWPANCGQKQLIIGYAGDEPSTQMRRENFQRACDELAMLCPHGTMNELIEQGVNAIVLNSLNGILLEDPGAIQAAVVAGIPVFLLDAELDMQGVISVTVDQAKWVQTSLEWMFEKIGGQGQFVYFDVVPAYHHGEVIEQMLAKYPGISVVGKGDGPDFDPFWVKPQTADYLINNPEIKALWTNTFWEGAIQGVEDESGADPDKWPLLMCEASSKGMWYWNEVLKRNPKFECIAVGNPSGIAYDAFYAANYFLNGSQIDPSALGGYYGRSLLVDFPVVTNENLQEMFDNNQSLDQVMSPEEILDQWFLD